MSNKSKNKGSSFERVVATHLSKVFSANFLRVPSSGAFTGGTNVYRMDKLTENQKRIMQGDIIPPDDLSHLKIECKSYRDFRWHHLYDSNKQLDGWLSQAESDGCLWFLIFKLNLQGSFVGTSKKFFTGDLGVRLTIPKCFTEYKNEKGDYLVFSMDDFFEANHDQIRALSTLFASK